MKKKIIYLLPLLFASFMLTSCEKEKVDLTYGTYVDIDINHLNEIDTTSLHNRLFNQKEVLLLAVHQGEYSKDCLCWSTYQNIIATYVNKYNEQVYVYNAQAQDETIKELNIAKLKESTPMLYIFNGTEKVASFSYSNNQDKKMFEETSGEAMYQRVHRYINEPKIHFVDTTFLDTKLEKHNNAVVLFMRSGCGDCKYVLPNTLIPYISSHNVKSEMLLFDMQPYYDQQNEVTSSSMVYDQMKKSYKLTAEASPEFGYANGVVPTFHYYEKGVLKDASVYFNDEIAQKEDGSYYISDSFYSEERLTSIKYTKTVLKGKALSSDEVLKTSSGYEYWAQEKAALKHDPLLIAFLDLYL